MKKTKIKYCKSEGLSHWSFFIAGGCLVHGHISTQWLQSTMPPDIAKYPLKGSLTQVRTIAVSQKSEDKI